MWLGRCSYTAREEEKEKEKEASVSFKITALCPDIFKLLSFNTVWRGVNATSSTEISYHIPDEVGQPIKQRLHSADELHVFGLVHSLLDEEDHKAGRDEGHGEDHADGNQHIY